MCFWYIKVIQEFQSTRPLRGGTRAAFPPRHGVPYFNPPAPCGAGLLQGWTSRTSRAISIHPPLAGRDAGGMAAGAAAAISIHPPLAGRDAPGPPWQLPPSYFNPPAPCGAGLRRTKRDGRLCDFNPPAPCGAGHRPINTAQQHLIISIHPPLAGRDPEGRKHQWYPVHFNPPAPCGAGPTGCGRSRNSIDFNPPAPCGAGHDRHYGTTGKSDFNPPAPCGAGLRADRQRVRQDHFNPPAPCGAGPPITPIRPRA